MKILKKLVCLRKGHKWEEIFNRTHTLDDLKWQIIESKCTRCGKTKEEVI